MKTTMPVEIRLIDRRPDRIGGMVKPCVGGDNPSGAYAELET